MIQHSALNAPCHDALTASPQLQTEGPAWDSAHWWRQHWPNSRSAKPRFQAQLRRGRIYNQESWPLLLSPFVPAPFDSLIAMPIAPEHRWLYPIDWPQLSAFIRFRRASGRCEQCRRPHGHTVLHLGEGTWWDASAAIWRDGRGRKVRYLPTPGALISRQPGLTGIEPPSPLLTTRVVLASAHLNHDPTENGPRNLKALCQRCHLLHDRTEHQRRRWLTLRGRKAIGDLFLGLYR